MSQRATMIKMAVAGIGLCVGGPALVWYVTPTEEELFKRYNPDLQRRSLENRAKNQEEFDHFVGRLKEYAKSDKPIWEAQADAIRKEAEQRRELITRENSSIAEELRKQQDAVRNATR